MDTATYGPRPSREGLPAGADGARLLARGRRPAFPAPRRASGMRGSMNTDADAPGLSQWRGRAGLAPASVGPVRRSLFVRTSLRWIQPVCQVGGHGALPRARRPTDARPAFEGDFDPQHRENRADPTPIAPVGGDAVLDAVAHRHPRRPSERAGPPQLDRETARTVVVAHLPKTGVEQHRRHPSRPAARHARELRLDARMRHRRPHVRGVDAGADLLQIPVRGPSGPQPQGRSPPKPTSRLIRGPSGSRPKKP